MTTTDIYQGLGSKSSSRVLAAPGGKSSISFGDPDDSPSRPVQNRQTESVENSPAGQDQSARDSHSAIFGENVDDGSPDNQKVKRVAKGTGEESSSGSEDEEDGTEENAKKKSKTTTRTIAKPPRGRYNPQTGDGQCSGYNPVTGEDLDRHDSDKVSPRQKYANDQTRGAYNPITGELYEDSPKGVDAASPSKDDKGRGDFNPITGEAYVPKKEVHTSTRVRQPPGGASSKLW